MKSTTEVRDEHIEDVTFQLYVLKGAGIRIRNVVLTHINNQGVYPHLDEILINQDLTQMAEEAQSTIKLRLKTLMEVADREQAPEVLIGRQCSNPYSCEFKAQCWAHVPKGSTLELYHDRKRKPTKFELFHSGPKLISDLKDEVELARFQQIQYLASKTDQPVIDRVGLAEFLNQVRYPIYYFDFETIAPPIPSLNGMRPYQRIPVQFSCHVQRSPNSALEHYEFLASGEPGQDPRVECLHAMLKIFDRPGTVVAYHDDFERSLIREMAEQFPEARDFLLDLEQSFWDLEDAFHHHFYHRSFGGSVSIKKVLPYFAPEMSYETLAVKNGGQAQAQLSRLFSPNLTAEERAQIRADLLTYCAQDSMAMVVIHQKLVQFALPNLRAVPRREGSMAQASA